MGKTMSSHFSAIFNWILFIFAGNEDMHKSLDRVATRQGKVREIEIFSRSGNCQGQGKDYVH